MTADTLPVALCCDCHMHFFDARFPMAAGVTRVVPDFSVADYARVQAVVATRRVVVVQPSTYGTDNRCTLEAMAAIGEDARGVAVVDTAVGDAELAAMHRQGVRGIRFNLVTAGARTTTPQMIEPLARRIADLGWHVQIYATGDQLLALEGLLAGLPVPLVIDHLGRIPMPAGVAHPAFRVVCDLLAAGRTWVKMSGANHFSAEGPPAFADVTPIAHAYVRIAPDRLVWGTDWPHPSLATGKPDPASLVALRETWIADPALLRRILIDNPAELYDYPAPAPETT